MLATADTDGAAVPSGEGRGARVVNAGPSAGMDDGNARACPQAR
jgi:hypothetical protein